MSRDSLEWIKGSESLESFKIVQQLRSDAKGFAAVCRLKLRDSGGNLKKLVGSFGITKIELLSKDTDGSAIVFLEGRRMSQWKMGEPSERGYQYPPFELTPKTWRKTFLGNETQIKSLLSKAERAGLKYRIVWTGEAQFRPSTLTSSLTDGQKRTLSTAYRIGYYDFPRRGGSDKLARTLDLSKATVSEHLRRAEKSILDQIFSE